MEATNPIQELWTELADILPQGWRSGAGAAILEGLSFVDALLSLEASDQFTLTTTIGSGTPLDFEIPGLADFGITVGELDDFGYSLELKYSAGVLSIGALSVPITIYLPGSFLRPVDDDAGLALIGLGTIRISTLGEVWIQLVDGLDLPPCFLGDGAGVVISASGLKLDLSVVESPPEVTAAGFDQSFVGLYFQEVRIKLPSGFPTLVPADLVLKKCVFGSGGVSGELDLTYDPVYDPASKTFSGNGAGDLFGIPFGVEHIEIVLRKNALTKSSFSGRLLLPFFDEPVEVDLGFDLDGNVTVEIASSEAGGLKTITRPNVLSLELDSIAFELQDGVFISKLSGKLTPLFGGLHWPTFDVKELSIDSEGHVHLDGGWLDLPKQYTLDFYGFKIEIAQLGFGKNDDGSKWIGFSGGLHLVDGLQAGASVEGLRITWFEDGSDPKISLNGAGVELEIPGVLSLKGEVSFHELPGSSPGETIRRFDGDIHLVLETPELEIDGTLVIGSVKGPQGRYNFFAIYVDVDLPTGIPLAATGLGIYGFAGLFALQMEPNKRPDEMWFGIDHSKSYYHRDTPGITDLKKKWDPRKGSFAVGLGVTLATLADNGTSFNGKFLLAIVIPGPIVLIQGAASFLKKRAEGKDEGQFRALAVIDGRQGSLLIGVDAKYKTGKKGELLEIGGSLEAFYAFHDPTAWHLYLGKNEPRDLRIRALFGHFVEANAYFMLDAHQLALGAWFGYKNGWSFGPLTVRLEAWADGNALLSFRPTHFHGDLWLHALVDLKVFGLGLGLALDAKIAADLFKPYHLRGEFSVGIKLPWPFKKKIAATVVLEWGPRKEAPPLPLPLVSAGIEHLKVSATWPLPRGTFLVPSYDDGEGFLRAHGSEGEPAASAVPLVPLDARIALTFSHSVHDEAKVGSNWQDIVPISEPIGDPARGSVLLVRYALKALTLARKVNGSWQTVAASSAGSSSGPRPLWGQWAVGPQLPDAGAQPPHPGQTKLLLGAKTPFEFNRHTGSSWEEWVSDAMPGYPCIPVQPAEESCFGFDGLQPGSTVPSPWTFPGPPAFTLSWGFGPATVRVRTVSAEGGVKRRTLLCFPEPAVRRGIRVHSETPGRRFRLFLAPSETLPGGSIPGLPIEMVPVSGLPGPHFEPALGSGAPSPRFEPSPDPGAPGPRPEPGTKTETLGPRGGTGTGTPGPRAEPFLGSGGPVALEPRLAERLPTCVDLRLRGAGTLSNPWSSAEGARFTVLGPGGLLLPFARVERWAPGELGLNAGFELDVALPCPADWVTLLVTHRPPFRIVAYDAAGTAVATHAPAGTGGTATETIRLNGPGITRITVQALGNEKLIHQICCLCARPSGSHATGIGADGTHYGPFVPADGVISVDGAEIPDMVLTGDGPLCLEQICITPDTEAGQGVRQDERIQHQVDELARWQATGGLFTPNSFYRLTVQTHLDVGPANHGLSGVPADLSPVENAYFRTGGPPGLVELSRPAGVTTDPFATGLEDLVRYVRETTPPTVPPPGEKPLLFKPFYRAYDVGLEFNEDYVEEMYRLDRRDLGLYLFDANNQPVRDGLGRLLVAGGEWGQAETLSLSEKETRWITLIDAATCLPKKLDPQTFPKDSALASADPGRVLAPDTLHEARLLPLLLHETFPGAVLGQLPDGWYAEDAGPGGSSSWKVGEAGEPAGRFVEQLSPIGGSGSDRPGTLLLLAEAQEWTDYRVSVSLRAASGAVGVVVRQLGPGTGYRFALDGRLRRLERVEAGGVTLLASDHFAYQPNHDYQVTIEALGPSLRAYLDGVPVFAVTDPSYAKGRLGLYACQSPVARFTDPRVDDFRAGAPVVYRFQFTTSLFANLYHHLHSYQDETWKADLGTDGAVGTLLNEAVLPSFSPPDEKEARAYEDLASRALGPAALQNPARVEVTRLERAGAPFGFLLRSPEPLAWDRIELALSSGAWHLPAPATPGAVKLTEATFGSVLAQDESATLLLREATDLSRYRVELRSVPGVVAELAGDPVLLLERFSGDPVSTLSRFTVIDQGSEDAPSEWQVEGGALLQLSEIRGGAEPELPGTVALVGDPAWSDYRCTTELRCDSGGALGLVFRWVDGGNYYRLSLDNGRKVRRLVKNENGLISILWEQAKGYPVGEPFQLTVEVVGTRLTAFLGGDRLFELRDPIHAAGQVGLYASGNPDTRCAAIEVRQPSLDAYALARDRFAESDLTGWGRIDEVPGTQPSTWEISGGELRLSSFVQQPDAPALPGTYAYAGAEGWTDVVYSARLRCPEGGELGLIFRGRDLSNYYRFSMSAQHAYRRLIKRVNGAATVLWEDGGSYPLDRAVELAVLAVGSSLRGFLDGVPLFVVEDGEVPAGRIGLYARNNPDARFSSVRVFPADRAFAGWTLDEPFDDPVPGRWSFLDGLSHPLPEGWKAEGGALRPAGADLAAPRLALTGDPGGTDYRLTVRVRPGATGLVGTVLRFVDNDNGLSFSLNLETGARRLVKKVQGVETALWEGGGPVPAGRELGLTLDAVGSRITGWLDGVELFRQQDADLPAGRVGFFTVGSPETSFLEVRVAEPAWTTWYAFGGEDPWPAGTRLRIEGGPAAGAPAAEAGVERRFAAPLGESGHLRFPVSGAELRLVTPAGSGHRRTFATPADSVLLSSPTVVRRADGTGLVLLPLGGSPLVEGPYRLELTYHRERAGQVHPFSQAGDRSPERAAIDIPWQAR